MIIDQRPDSCSIYNVPMSRVYPRSNSCTRREGYLHYLSSVQHHLATTLSVPRVIFRRVLEPLIEARHHLR